MARPLGSDRGWPHVLGGIVQGREHMSRRIGSKRGLLIGGLAVVALLVFTALPGMAASARYVSLGITPQQNPTLPATAGQHFYAKVTNTSPVGSVSNPNSVRVTVPTSPTSTNTSFPKFKVTNAVLVAGSGNSSNANQSTSLVISWTDAYVTVNGLDPLQRSQYVTIDITVSTPDIACDSTATSGPWAAGASTSSTFGQGQSFSQTGTAPKTTLSKTCPLPPGAIAIDTEDPLILTSSSPLATKSFVDLAPVNLFTSTVTGTPPLTITWQSSTTLDFASATTVSTCIAATCPLSFTAAIASDGTYYRAQASSAYGSTTTSNVIQIDVFEETIQCGDTVPETGGGTHVDVTLVDQAGCEPKDISIIAAPISGGNKVEVLTSGTGTVTFVVNFNAWAPEPQQTPVPASTAIPPEPLGEIEVWCDGTYSDLPADLPAAGGTYGMSMPTGHTWCRILQTAVGAGVDPADPDVTPDILPGTPLMKVSEISLLEGDAGKTRCCI
jgi:hypothetical protein